MTDSPYPDYALLDRAGAAATSFYPRTEQGKPPPAATDQLLEVEPGIHLDSRIYTVDRGAPTILYFHGNGEVVSDHDGAAQFYEQIGVNLFVVEFRGYGASDGVPSFETLIADARKVAELGHALLDERGFGGPRYVMGRSMGAHSALEIAAHAPGGFSGLILESGAANLRRWADRLGHAPNEAARLLAEHEAKIRSIRLPTLMIHGALDELIPLDRAREIYEMLDGTQRGVVIIPNAGHNDIMWVGYQEYFSAIHEFIEGTRGGLTEGSDGDEGEPA